MKRQPVDGGDRPKDRPENTVQCLVCGRICEDMDAAAGHLDDAHRLVTNLVEDHTRAVVAGCVDGGDENTAGANGGDGE